jgi:hypothetical protein
MNMRFAAAICSTLTGLMVLSSQAVAEQKTIKACQEEWRANKATNQANGITEKSYVDQCRAGGAPTQPTAAPAPSTAPPSSPATTARPSSLGQARLSQDIRRSRRAKRSGAPTKLPNKQTALQKSPTWINVGRVALPLNRPLPRHHQLLLPQALEQPLVHLAQLQDKRRSRRAKRSGAPTKLPIKRTASQNGRT